MLTHFLSLLVLLFFGTIHPAARQKWGKPPAQSFLLRGEQRLFFLGAAEGVAARAAAVLEERHPGIDIVTHSPTFGFETDPDELEKVRQMVRDAAPQVLILALGCPKQELLMHRWRDELGGTVAIGAGATLDFIAGDVSRSPSWVSSMGFEWLYRLAREPRRLAHRYLVRDPEIVKIAWRMLRHRDELG